MKPVLTTPNDVLTTPSKVVEKIDSKVRQIIADMKETLLGVDKPKGVGLAAPQIGVSLRIFITRPHDTDLLRVFINPSFAALSKKMIKGIPGSDKRLEGCLSIPRVWGLVTRHFWVKLKFMDETGTTREEKFIGFLAVIIQHEMDHLEGILFTLRVLEQKGQLFKPGEDKDGKEILEPLEI